METHIQSVRTHCEKYDALLAIEPEIYCIKMNSLTREKPIRKVHGFIEGTGGEFSFYGLRVYFRGPAFKPGSMSETAMMASFLLNTDVSPLFPYLNTVAERAELHQAPRFIRFLYEDCFCVLYPKAGIISPVEDQSHARALLESLVSFLNDIYLRRDKITPNRRIHERVSVLNILKLLPKTNCGQCGHPSCMAFAASLSLQESAPEKCPHIQSPLGEQAFYPVYDAEGNLVSTVAININTARIADRQNKKDVSAGSNLKDRPDVDPGNVEEANESLPMPLSERELEVLCILAEGTSNNDIAHMLNVSPHTVKSHVIHIFNKLGVNDRTQAAVWAARHHLV
jgi:DNA-binding CsgD family transcriptional regulator/ArsR family metal-binding transcriptional regulator